MAWINDDIQDELISHHWHEKAEVVPRVAWLASEQKLYNSDDFIGIISPDFLFPLRRDEARETIEIL